MFEQMLGLVKGQVSKSLSGIEGIPAGKESAVVETTTSSLMSGLKKFATPDKLSGLLGMVGGGGGGAKNTGVNTIGTGVVSALTSKVGLNPAVAAAIANKVVPAVLSLLSKNVGDASKPGFNIGSIVGALGGGGGGGLANAVGGMLGGGKAKAGAGAGGGIMDAVGSLFGKK